jgi:hypothetical protein
MTALLFDRLERPAGLFGIKVLRNDNNDFDDRTIAG